MTSTNLKPYQIAQRNLHQDAWFLYQTSSLAYYECCARLCEDFANLYNTLITDNGVHGAAALDYWVARYRSHASSIRLGMRFVELGGDYMSLLDLIEAPSTDFRGMVEQPLGWMSDEDRSRWDLAIQKVIYACGTAATTLSNNRGKGNLWLQRMTIGADKVYLDRDDSHAGDTTEAIELLNKQGILPKLPAYPLHAVDRTLTTAPGHACPRSGVWVPKQWLDGATDFSLAFGVHGQPMQPAYRIIGLETDNPFAGYDEEMAEEYEAIAEGSPVTEAHDTTWFFIEAAPSSQQSAEDNHMRCEAGTPCPKSGYWMTPAKAASRRYFQRGGVMPEVASDYGTTIWQWDTDQSDPKL
ncbi:hypothetical protein [Cupriavidus sp. H39]|uniref:hypothetical protein n=1 Tax=Cupriavidus sp. H39 TaxID=3401635 RepID=UPI003CFF6C24